MKEKNIVFVFFLQYEEDFDNFDKLKYVLSYKLFGIWDLFTFDNLDLIKFLHQYH